jgi:hypothetical protein
MVVQLAPTFPSMKGAALLECALSSGRIRGMHGDY